MANKKTATPKTKQATSDLINDIEKLGEALSEDMKSVFSKLRVKVSDTAKTAAEDLSEKTSAMRESISEKTSAVTDEFVERASSVADKVSHSEFSRHFSDIVDHIEESGENILDAVSKRIDNLRGKIAASRTTNAKKKPLKKKPAVKTSKKKAVKKKAAKKKAVKKTAAKKKKAVSKKS